MTLGVLTVLLRKPADVASTHVAVGALVLVTEILYCCFVPLGFIVKARNLQTLRAFAILDSPSQSPQYPGNLGMAT